MHPTVLLVYMQLICQLLSALFFMAFFNRIQIVSHTTVIFVLQKRGEVFIAFTTGVSLDRDKINKAFVDLVSGYEVNTRRFLFA